MALLLNPYTWLALAVAVLIACATSFYYGLQYKQQQWDAALTKQTGEAMSVMIDKERNKAAAEIRFNQVQTQEQPRTKVVQKEVMIYVQSPADKCVLSADFVRAYDDLSGLLNPGAFDLPTPDGAAGTADESSVAQSTDAEVLRDKEERSIAERELWLKYVALRDWVRSDYALASEGAGR